MAVDYILETPGLSGADRVAMLGETAAKLLGMKPSLDREPSSLGQSDRSPLEPGVS
jgi:hypothetical protein